MDILAFAKDLILSCFVTQREKKLELEHCIERNTVNQSEVILDVFLCLFVCLCYVYFPKKRSTFSVSKKCISQNLRNWACKLKSLRPLDYEKKWFKFGSSNSKIDTSDLILLHSPNFGQPKQGPNFFFEFFFIFLGILSA